jgi:hypothetical protein
MSYWWTQLWWVSKALYLVGKLAFKRYLLYDYISIAFLDDKIWKTTEVKFDYKSVTRAIFMAVLDGWLKHRPTHGMKSHRTKYTQTHTEN